MRRTNTWTVLAVTASGASAALALWLLEPAATPSTPTPAPVMPVRAATPALDDGASEQLATQVVRLQRELGSLSSRVQLEVERARQAAEQGEPAEAQPTEAQALADIDPAVVRGHYEQLFDEQSVDDAWSRAESTAITQHFVGGAVSGIELRRVDCRTNMCRVELRVADDAKRGPFLRDIGLPPFQHGGYYHNDLESDEIVLFSAREGSPLPMYSAGG